MTITQDCNTCHEPLAIEEATPGVLKTIGLADRIASLQKQQGKRTLAMCEFVAAWAGAGCRRDGGIARLRKGRVPLPAESE